MSKVKSWLRSTFKSIFLSSQGLPIFLSMAVLGVLFVLFRMKGVEIDYQVTEINKKMDKVIVANKTLKAKKAKMLSIKKLRAMAKRHNLKEPTQKQIIVVP